MTSNNDGVFEVSTPSNIAQHLFTTSGPQTVRVRVSDSSGASALSSIVINVANSAPVIASATAERSQGVGRFEEGQRLIITVVANDTFETETHSLRVRFRQRWDF